MRVIAFGDSHTYGEELPGGGGHGLAGKFGYDQPSPVAWPQLIADQLSYECVNLAQPGYSNKEILISILKYNFQPDDRALVLWTHIARDVIFEIGGTDVKVSPNRIKDNFKAKYYYMSHGEHDMKISAWLHVSHAASHFHAQQIKFGMATYDAWDSDLCVGTNYININKTFRDHAVDLAKDNMHLGVQSHVNMSRQIISDLGW